MTKNSKKVTKDDAYYEALNRRLMAAISTLTGGFILLGIILYFILT